jgi:hypothetical protein
VGTNLDPVMNLVTDLDAGLDSGFVLASDLKLGSISGTPGSSSGPASHPEPSSALPSNSDAGVKPSVVIPAHISGALASYPELSSAPQSNSDTGVKPLVVIPALDARVPVNVSSGDLGEISEQGGVLRQLSQDSDLKQASSSGEPGAASGSPETQMEISPGSLVCSPEFSLTHGSGAEVGIVEVFIEVEGDILAQGEGSIGEIQVHSSRLPELLTEKPPNSPERSPELSLIRGPGVDDGTFVEASIGVAGDRSAQGVGSNGEFPVSYPDFPLPWESDGESDSESDSEAPFAGEPYSVSDSVTVDPPR